MLWIEPTVLCTLARPASVIRLLNRLGLPSGSVLLSARTSGNRPTTLPPASLCLFFLLQTTRRFFRVSSCSFHTCICRFLQDIIPINYFWFLAFPTVFFAPGTQDDTAS